jgi:hypothetical protein
MNSYNGRGRRRGVPFLWGAGALALLTAAGCGVVADLGENPRGDGGEGGDGGEPVAAGTNAGGSTANQGGTGAGGNGGALAGAGAGGSHAPVIEGGGEGGGSGAGNDPPDLLPYPLQPTIPISADCSCANASSVCNAQNQCVPRCEPGGVCAVWRIERGFTSTLVNGDDMYFVLAAPHDLFGNPVEGDEGKETLWKARYPDLAPTKIAALPGVSNQLVGHVGNTTYSRAWYNGDASLVALADDGTTTARELPPNMAGFPRVTEAGAFAMAIDGSIAKLEVNGDGSFGQGFVPAVPAPGVNGIPYDLFVGDRLWRAQLTGEICSFDLAALDAPGDCNHTWTLRILGASGSHAFILGESFNVKDVDVGTGAVRLLSDIIDPAGMALRNGWVTMVLTDENRVGPSTLARIPVASPAPPTPLISNEVATAIANSGVDFPGLAGPMVTSDAVYFSQALQEPKGPGTSRYIFRAPLPE